MMKRFTLLIAWVLFLNCSLESGNTFAVAADEPEVLYSFIQMSDPQLGFGEQSGFAEGEALLKKMVEVVNTYRPSFVIVTGDMTNSSRNESQYKAYRKLMSMISPDIPVYHVPGNHDMKLSEDRSMSVYRERYGEDRFSFGYGGSYFIGINSNIIVDGIEELELEQKQWLEVQLEKASGSDHVFVFMHCPIVTGKIDEPDTYSNFPAARRSEYVEIFDKYHVTAVFAGHLHQCFECVLKDFRMITCGPSGKPLGKGYPGFNFVSVTKDNYSCKYIAL